MPDENGVESTGSALDDLDLVAEKDSDLVAEKELAVVGEPGEYYIANSGTRVSVQSWTERSTADYALKHGHYTSQDA